MKETATKNFLFEIGCAELPAKILPKLSHTLKNNLQRILGEAHIAFSEIQTFATPRRLAFLIHHLNIIQPSKIIEKKGPSLKAPDAAIQGFAKSVGLSADALIQKDNYYYHCYEEPGQKTEDIIAPLLSQAVSALHHFKTMRWGNHTVSFVRPVYWTVLLFGEQEIQTDILGTRSSAQTIGHRVHCPHKLTLPCADDYENMLFEEGFVRADVEKRKTYIREQLMLAAQSLHGSVVMDEDLLDEVTGLVEWPVILPCHFAKHFLTLPKEVLISSIQHHQKCFALSNSQEDNQLLPVFLTVSNLQSTKPEAVIAGNTRVMQARLSDALFFYEQDKKTRLGDYLKTLDTVIFQQKLGSMGEKVKRIVLLADELADKLQTDKSLTRRAAILCKADLVTQMVGEFPELQGIMGYYYAKAEDELEETALGIREHYLPRFAKDHLPKSPIGCVLALADRFDTLNSIFSINLIPTGEKDPFGLRRAALGIIRIIIEKSLHHINLSDFCKASHLKEFILDRLPNYYQDSDISQDYLQAVLEIQQDNLVDIHLRITALKNFMALPAAGSLIEANKRVRNILKKNSTEFDSTDLNINSALFDSNSPAENTLYQKIREATKSLSTPTSNYSDKLNVLAEYRESIDNFFKDIMVESDNLSVKQNRLKLLQHLRNLFLQVADISLINV